MKKNSQHQISHCFLHLDGDAFFVAVEVAKNPALRGLPVVTGEERGIVSALSYEAKALGVVRGMPIFKLRKQFPTVIILPGDYTSYAHYSSMMFDVVRRYVEHIEEYSIDECFADMTGLDRTLKMTYRQIAERIQREIRDELDLSVTVGLAPTKVLAKIASKWVKPCGLTEIRTENVEEFLAKTPIESIWGIGRRTTAKFHLAGIITARDFRERDLAWVKHTFSKPYVAIWLELHSIVVFSVDTSTKSTYSSIQQTRTFHPVTNDMDYLRSQISKHLEGVCAKARRYNLAPKNLFLFLKTQKFSYVTKRIPLVTPTNTPETILPLLHVALLEIHADGVLYRATGVTLGDLVPYPLIQPSLFEAGNEVDKFVSIHKNLDILEAKLGKRMVYLASTHKARSAKKLGTEYTDPKRNLLFL